jgi:hypothetical protein
MPPTAGPEGTLAGVARWVGRNRDLAPGERSSTRVMPVAHHPAASACAMKFSSVFAPDDRGRHRTQRSAGTGFADAVLQAGGRGT